MKYRRTLEAMRRQIPRDERLPPLLVHIDGSGLWTGEQAGIKYCFRSREEVDAFLSDFNMPALVITLNGKLPGAPRVYPGRGNGNPAPKPTLEERGEAAEDYRQPFPAQDAEVRERYGVRR